MTREEAKQILEDAPRTKLGMPVNPHIMAAHKVLAETICFRCGSELKTNGWCPECELAKLNG